MNKSIFCILAAIILVSCGHDELKVDVSDVKVPEMSINRLEQDMFKMDTLQLTASVQTIKKKYGKFFNSFLSGVLNNGGMHDSSAAIKIKQFISDKDMREAYNDCQKEFPDVNNLRDECSESFRYFKHYFPEKPLPKVVTMMSGFNYSVVTLDSTLGIGLEMYLGSGNKFYPMLGLPRYKIRCMNKENIIPDVMRGWMLNEFPYMMDKNDFLSQIIYLGKIMYLTDALTPSLNDTLKTQYTAKQTSYCKQNEFNMWSYFIAEKILYTTDHAQIMKFTTDGPFTTAFSKDAPPRVGYWIGRQIIKQYMKNNPDITMVQMLKEKDAQKILTKAKYKPGK